MFRIARRALLASPFKLFTLLFFGQPNLQSATVSLSDFMALSSRLTARTGLNPTHGRIYLSGLLADPKTQQRLSQLVNNLASDQELENKIILSWYTGAYTVAGEAKLATHSGALLWKALALPAPGACSGKTGSWSTPPSGII